MVKGLKDENAPARPLSAYFAWQNSVREKVTKAMPEGSKIGDVAKKFSEMWGAMSDSSKAPFQTKYEAAMAKYKKKMEKYKTTKDYAKFMKAKEEHKVDTLKKSKFKKDENAPSRPLSAYFLFLADEREELVAGGMTHKEAMSKMAEMWSSLSAAKKKPYEEKAASLKAKYAKVLEKYKKTAQYKKYQKEKDEFYYNKKLALRRLEASRSKSAKPKAPKRSVSRSKSKKRSARKASKPKAPKRSVSRSKSKARKASKPKKAKSRSRSRSKSKKVASAKKSAKKATKPAAVQ